MDEDRELLLEFRTESIEHFGEIEPLFLEIESLEGAERNDVINRIFRAVHSVKGAAGFFELDRIQKLSHTMENLLMRVRDGELDLSAEMTDALLTGLDKLEKLVDALPERSELPIDEEVSRLVPFVEGAAVARQPLPETAPDSANTETQAPTPEPTATAPELRLTLSEDAWQEASRFGQRILEIRFPEAGDASDLAAYRATTASIGKIVAEPAPGAAHTCVLVATVLEPDLAAAALNLPPSGISVRSGFDAPAKPDSPPPKADSARAEPPKAGPPKPARSGAESAETVRVSVKLLDQLMNLAGELVLGRNQLLARLGSNQDTAIKSLLQNVDLVTSELQTNIMNTRMQPVGNVFKKFHRVVRDMSRKLGKQVELELEGTDVELDKSIIELLSDPLTHLVRNSLDHGIETPAKRGEAGKPAMGRIVLRAFHEGGQVNIEIRDDGAGIDPEKMRRIATEKGMMGADEAAALSDGEARVLIFSAGFSSAEQVTDVSGRGVGMDVVRANIGQLGGKIEVESEIGSGTSMRIQLPLTLAIIPSLIVGVGDEEYAVPQVNLVEIVRVRAEDAADRLENVNGADVLRLRGNLLPLVRLADVLEIPEIEVDAATGTARTDRRRQLADRRGGTQEHSPEGVDARNPCGTDRRATLVSKNLHVLVLRVGENVYGLVVDRVHDSEEIVVKPLSSLLKGRTGYAGATIMGDGRVAMILDVAQISDIAQLCFREVRAAERAALQASAVPKNTRDIVIFANSRKEQFAVELEQILRLERIEADAVERIGAREYVQHLGRGIPLIRLEEHLPVRPIEPEGDELFVLIPKAQGQPAGILASRVIDTVTCEVDLDRSADDPEPILGRAVLGDQLTTFLDVELLLAAACSGAPS